MARKKKVSTDPAELDQLRELVDSDGEDGSDGSKTHSRRGLLKIAGAAVAGAAGMAAMRVVPASAATGQAVLQGCQNFPSASNETEVIQLSGGAPLSSTGSALAGRGPVGIEGSGNYATNRTLEVGVFGFSKGSNLDGTNGIGTGVLGASNGGTAVEGDSSTGIGGHFTSTSGYDVLLGTAISGTIADPNFHGSGRLAMVGRTDVGTVAPNVAPFFLVHSSLFAGGHFQHELVRGNDGSIWASTASMAGTNQSRWKRVNTVRTDISNGTGGFFKPFRLLDTRSGAIKTAGSVTHVQVAGAGTGSSAIPADAIAVMGNLTAAGYTGGGFLTIMPDGITIGTGAGQYNPASDPSSVNFIVGQYAIANSFVCGLNAGKLEVYVGGPPLPGHSSHFIIDITAYLQ